MSFYGLEIAKTGLFTSRKAMEVVGHNVSNANTAGYTRQRVVSASIAPMSLNQRFSPITSAAVGAGVEVISLDQIRNDYIDRELRRENADSGLWGTKTGTIEYIESLFDETSKSSITKAISDFFDSVSDLTTDTVSKEMRTNVQQNAIKLTETFNHYYNQLAELQREQNENMKYTVDQINDILTSIANYDKQIATFELSGEKANDMRDKRNVLLDELSQKINITYYEDAQGRLVVEGEDGTELVNHDTVQRLVAVANQTGVVTGQTGFYSIYYETTPPTVPSVPFVYSSGELEAYRTMRDGNSVNEVGIPRLIDNLNTLARSLSQEFNTVHRAGYTMAHDAVASATNVDLFNVPAGGYANVNAGNFSLSAAVLADVFQIAASDTLIDLTAANTQQGNNKNALALLALCNSNTIAGIGGFENYMKSTVSELATSSNHAQNMNASQQAIIENLGNRRESVSGVSIDEEMTEMVKFQHSYAAASRMINAIDEELDVLINKTGIVGR